MDRFVDFESLVEDRSVAGFEKSLHHFDGEVLVGLGRFDALDPAAKKSLHRVSLGRKKRSADDDGAAGITDRQLAQIDHLVKAEFFGLESGIARNDGAVDGADLALWTTGFEMSSGASLADGDYDGDHDVDGADFLAWQRGFGTSPNLAAVAEPSTCALGAVAAMALGACRRWGR